MTEIRSITQQAIYIANEIKKHIPELQVDDTRDYGRAVEVYNPTTAMYLCVLEWFREERDKASGYRLIQEDIPFWVDFLNKPPKPGSKRDELVRKNKPV